MEEWEKHMSDFEPADLLTLPLPSKGVEVKLRSVEVA